MKKQLTKAGYILLLTASLLLIVFSFGITFAAFHAYKAASSGPHTINKLGYTAITVTSTDKVYPGATVNGAFSITNQVQSGYGTLPIVIDSITVQKIEAYVPGVSDPVELTTGSGGVVSYTLNRAGIEGQAIASGATRNVSFSMTFATSATYSDAQTGLVTLDTPDYLINQTTKIVVTFLIDVQQQHILSS